MAKKQEADQAEIITVGPPPRTAPVDISKLQDLAIRFEMNLKRAKCLMEELTVDYLGIPDMSPVHPEYWKLIAGYEEYSTKADIVFDYLLNLRGLLKELNAISGNTGVEG